jgi:hypothetical protein
MPIVPRFGCALLRKVGLPKEKIGAESVAVGIIDLGRKHGVLTRSPLHRSRHHSLLPGLYFFVKLSCICCFSNRTCCQLLGAESALSLPRPDDRAISSSHGTIRRGVAPDGRYARTCVLRPPQCRFIIIFHLFCIVFQFGASALSRRSRPHVACARASRSNLAPPRPVRSLRRQSTPTTRTVKSLASQQASSIWYVYFKARGNCEVGGSWAGRLPCCTAHLLPQPTFDDIGGASATTHASLARLAY